MRVRFLHDQYDSDEAFWTRSWAAGLAETLSRPPAPDPVLTRVIDRHVRPGALFLEGGCGNCTYVRHYHARGHKMIGVDFSAGTVEAVGRAFPELDLRVGNILAFDFPDDTFDAYYSGGVIEHFEGRIDPQIREAHRVLKPGGLFLCSVPHMNWQRRLTSLFSRRYFKRDMDGRLTMHAENVRDFDLVPAPEGYHFHEYVLTTGEMRRYLARNGFEIIEEMEFHPDWGLLDTGIFRSLAGVDAPRRHFFHRACGTPLRMIRACMAAQNPLARAATAGLCAALGNSKVYVCRAVKPAPAV